jgi:hypothetical protein
MEINYRGTYADVGVARPPSKNPNTSGSIPKCSYAKRVDGLTRLIGLLTTPGRPHHHSGDSMAISTSISVTSSASVSRSEAFGGIESLIGLRSPACRRARLSRVSRLAWGKLVAWGVLVTAGLLACGSIGCESPRRGDSGGRLQTSETTAGEKRSRQANLAVLTEFSDEAVDVVVEELLNFKPSLDPNTMYVLYLGDLRNKTSATPTGDFELFANRIKSRLVNEKRVREFIQIRNDPRQAQATLDRFTSDGPSDVLQEGRAGKPGVDRVDPNYMLILNGEFFDAVRSGKSQFFFDFTIVQPQTGNVLISASRDLAQAN